MLAGESLPLFVSTTARGFTATAYRLGWYQGHGARQVWKSRTVRGGAQKAAAVSAATNTVTDRLGPGAPGAHRRLAAGRLPGQA